MHTLTVIAAFCVGWPILAIAVGIGFGKWVKAGQPGP